MGEKQVALRYGCNWHQKPARMYSEAGVLPFEVLNGAPGYINMLDALNAWQLVKELRQATGLPAAASFKHVSPAGAAVGLPLSDALRGSYFVGDMELSPQAAAYARARGADRVSSFGDMVALSDEVDVATANLIRLEVSDGVIAPGFAPEALEILRQKKGGKYLLIQIDADYEPGEVEVRDVFDVMLEQKRNDAVISADMFGDIVTENKDLPESAVRDMLVAQVALKYIQSNSVCFAVDGQVVGAGAGQQSRVHCTRLAASKADLWYLRQHPATLGIKFREGLSRAEMNNGIDGFLLDDLSPAELKYWETHYFDEVPQRLSPQEKRAWLDGMKGVALASDAFFPFRDSIDRASQSGVQYVVQPGGSARDDVVIGACDEYGMVMAFTGVRLFHH